MVYRWHEDLKHVILSQVIRIQPVKYIECLAAFPQRANLSGHVGDYVSYSHPQSCNILTLHLLRLLESTGDNTFFRIFLTICDTQNRRVQPIGAVNFKVLIVITLKHWKNTPLVRFVSYFHNQAVIKKSKFKGEELTVTYFGMRKTCSSGFWFCSISVY